MLVPRTSSPSTCLQVLRTTCPSACRQAGARHRCISNLCNAFVLDRSRQDGVVRGLLGQSKIMSPALGIGLPSVVASINCRQWISSNGAASRSTAEAQKTSLGWAAISFGSNVGDRVEHIESALKALRDRGISVMHVSQLYETEPMYYLDQDTFLNGVALVTTDKDPLELLDTLQSIELKHQRTWDPAKPKGPRTLDLDVLIYGGKRVSHGRLILPHVGINERAFVLRPLKDVLRLMPQSVVADFMAQAPGLARDIESLTQVTVLASRLHIRRVHDEWSTRNIGNTHIMSIMNVTPDSFSDGGEQELETIIASARQHIKAGGAILDIGGQSTRPGATVISAEEELTRILPVLRALRDIPEVSRGQVAISIDTFHAKVVDTCAREGLIDIVNDISGGTHDAEMFNTVARHQLSIVIMHMRGTVTTMHKDMETSTDIVEQIVSGLQRQATLAEQAGIPRWRIILDPGVGFSKTETQNLDILARLDEQMSGLKQYAWLVGASRKGFLGRITGVKEANDRDFATAAVTAQCVGAGVDIVRVHATKSTSEVVKVSKALWWREWERKTQQAGSGKNCQDFWMKHIELQPKQ